MDQTQSPTFCNCVTNEILSLLLSRHCWYADVKVDTQQTVESVEVRSSHLVPGRNSVTAECIICFTNATICPLWTSWSPLPVVAEVYRLLRTGRP
jgi:hypothetical protein